MRHGSIYVATNKHTGEQYVGQTRQLVQKRWDAHWRTATCSKARKAKFQTALLAAGKDAFVVDELFVAFDADALNNAEISLIAELKPAYNASRGGKGLRPIIVSEETKAKRSKDAKARWANPEWKAKTVISIKLAVQNSDKVGEQARRMAFAHIGTKASTETKARMSAAHKERNTQLVLENTEKTRMIYAEHVAGAKIGVTCEAYGLSRQAFYRHIKQLRLPLFGQKHHGGVL